MRTLSDELLAEQRKPTRRPAVKVEVQAYEHPAQSSVLQWQPLDFQLIYADQTTPGKHAVAIAGDGSLHRLYSSPSIAQLFYQRVASPSPSSNFAPWTDWGSGMQVNSPVAIIARGAELWAFASSGSGICYRTSTDYGATWGSWTVLDSVPAQGYLAACYNSSNDNICVVWDRLSVSIYYLYQKRRVSSVWQTTAYISIAYGPLAGISVYHEDQENYPVVFLAMDGNYLRSFYTGVFATQFLNIQTLGLGRAQLSIPQDALLRAQAREQVQQLQRRYGTTYGTYVDIYRQVRYWEREAAINKLLAGEGLSLSGPAMAEITNYTALFSLQRDGAVWLFRLAKGHPFRSARWTQTDVLTPPATSLVTYGLAIAQGSEYIWLSAANQVWRALSPASWSPPTAGAGAGDKITLPADKVLSVAEALDPEQPSELTVELDNSKGTYNSPGSGSLAVVKRGSRVNLHLGYKTPSGDLVSEAARYFIEAMEYKRDPNTAAFTLHCTDAWGLLQHYQFNKPVEWNSQVVKNDMLCENYTVTPGSKWGTFYGATWLAQTFTSTIAHKLTRVILGVTRGAGSPGTMTVSIRATSGGAPTGGDLASATIDGNAVPLYATIRWCEFAFSTPIDLAASTPYAIVVRCTGGDASNYLRLNGNIEKYDNGSGYTSNDSGSSWSHTGGDYFFEEYGYGGDLPISSVYQLIEKVIQAVGGTLTYKSRSDLITSLYPKLDVSAGESASSVLKRLLALVPDVIYFFGLEGYIVHPQSADTAVYKFKFPP